MSMPSSKASSSKSSKASTSLAGSSTDNATSGTSPSTSSNSIKDPIPGTSFEEKKTNKPPYLIAPGCSCSPLDDPKPGPSTSAADFDLEVFDSCSSCSLEDCWGVDCPNSSCESSPLSGNPPTTLVSRSSHKFHRKGNKRSTSEKPCSSAQDKVCRARLPTIPSDLSDNSSEEDLTMASPQIEDPDDVDGAETVSSTENISPDYEPASACPSETEEATSVKDDAEEDVESNQEGQEEEPKEVPCQCNPKKAFKWFNGGPSQLEFCSSNCKILEARLLKIAGKKRPDPLTEPYEISTNDNIDEIVQDHDNFGTDENEDSLDSVATLSVSLASPATQSTASDATVSHSKAEQKLTEHTGSKRKVNRVASPDRVSSKKKRKDTKSKSDAEQQQPSSELRTSSSVHLFLGQNSEQVEEEFCSTKDEESKPEQNQTSSSISLPSCAKSSNVQEQQQQQPMKLIPDKDNPPQEMLDWVEAFQRWSHAQRLLAIDQLIGKCEPTQVRHMMTVIEPQFQRDFISLLPKELALYVLSFLKPRDLLNAAQTCRYWRILAEDNLLWREKCREVGLPESKCIRKRKPSPCGFVHSSWKLGFIREHNIETNWRTRSCRTPKILKGHDDHVITCLQFGNNRIVSGSDDNTLKVWNASTGRCLRTLVGHTGGVWSSQMEGNVIVSGSTDRTLKVWNAETGVCEHTLYGHTSTVRCMHLHNNLVVSGSRDATLRMWDITTGECLHILTGHVAAVRCVQYDGRLVVSGAYDYMVKVWNPVTEECLHTLSGHTNRVYSLQFDGVHVVSGSLDTSIRVWDVETGACKHALMGHQSLTSGMELKDNILVSGNADSTVKVWDIKTGRCLQTLSGSNKHQSAVTCLQFNSKFVITSSDDGTVKLWDVKTGGFIRNLVALKSGGSGGVVWRIRANETKLVCAVGSRNGTEETKLLVLDFDSNDNK